jgi:hypothetical protein
MNALRDTRRDKRVLRPSGFVLVGAAIAAFGGCSASFGTVRSSNTIDVSVKTGDRGKADARLPLSLTTPAHFTVTIVARTPQGNPDPNFNGYVRISVKPGQVLPVTTLGGNGRNVLLKNGQADDVGVDVLGAYGDSHIWVDDVGYLPADPTRAIPPQCSDGLDNNGNGVIDFPSDPGCAFANDDSEDLGSYVAGTSETLFFSSPRIEDVRGFKGGGSSTPFSHEQILLDTGYRPKTNNFDFSVVVTRISADGFYAADLEDDRVDRKVPQTLTDGRHGYSSVFAFNFSAPPKLRVCDRLTTYTGTASDFFGFTELGFPTWSVEEYDPAKRDCLVPEPFEFDIAGLSSTPIKLRYESALVRIAAGPHKVLDVGARTPTDRDGDGVPDAVDACPDVPGRSASVPEKNGCPPDFTLHVGKHFGLNFPKDPAYAPADDATNCDLNRNGKIDHTAGNPEATCSDACTADPECTEYSNFATRSEFRLVLTDVTNPAVPVVGGIQANASTASRIDPLALRGQDLKSFSGTFRYFSGGSQFTIEARCQDDIVVDLNQQPMLSKDACVVVRTLAEQTAN